MTSFTPNALYFGPGCPATGLPCRVDVSPAGLTIQSAESVIETAPYTDLTVTSGGFDCDHVVLSWTIDGKPRQVYVREPALIQALRTSARPEVGGHIHRSVARAARARQMTHAWMWAAVVSVIAVLIGLWMASDVLVRLAVDRIPVDWERSLGESARAELLAGQRAMKEGPVVHAVEEMTRRLSAQLPADRPYRFEVTVVHNDEVNAVALPGGSVIVYTGFLKQAESPEEVAGVLAHELNHVRLRHGLEGMVQSVGVMAMVMIVLGNQQGLAGALQRLGIQVATLKFSREKETEADLEGLRLLHRAHISPFGMMEFFERLAKTEHAATALLSTHPMSAERAARLKREAEALPPERPEPFSFDWQAIKKTL